MRVDNLQVADGVSVHSFLSNYYDQIIESAENIIRGNKKFDSGQRKELAVDLVSMLSLHLLEMPSEPPNVGKYSHKWMKNQVCWQRTAFEKLSQVNTHEYDYNIKDEIAEEPEDRLASLETSVQLNPFEQVIYSMLRKQMTVAEMLTELDNSVPSGTIHNTLRNIKKKFIDTYNDGRNNDDNLRGLPDNDLDSQSADSAA